MIYHPSKVPLSLLLVSVAWTSPVDAISSSKLGEQIYSDTCITCHGEDGKGALDGVPDLTASDGRLSKKDTILISSIKNGLEKSDAPLSMPAKGGDDEITPRGIKSVLTYIRQKFGSGKNRRPIR